MEDQIRRGISGNSRSRKRMPTRWTCFVNIGTSSKMRWTVFTGLGRPQRERPRLSPIEFDELGRDVVLTEV